MINYIWFFVGFIAVFTSQLYHPADENDAVGQRRFFLIIGLVLMAIGVWG